LCLARISNQIKFRRNDCCPLFCLPPEIIGEILTIAALYDPPHAPAARTIPTASGVAVKQLHVRRAHLGWISFGHVCRRLRGHLLGLRSLWGAIAFTLPNAQDQILSRAGLAPVVINFNYGYVVTNKQVDLAMTCITRARAITVDTKIRQHVSRRIWTLNPRDLSRKEFPLLEELSLELNVQDVEPLTSSVYELPPMIAPRLRSLRFRNYYAPFYPSSLTSLELVRVGPSSSNTLPSPDIFLCMLRSCSQLQNLTLTGCIPQLTPSSPEELDSGKIELPHLAGLGLAGPTERCAALWSRLNVPPAAFLHFRLDFIEYDIGGAEVPVIADDNMPYQDPRRLDFMATLGRYVCDRTPYPVTGLSIVDLLRNYESDIDANDELLRIRLTTPWDEPATARLGALPRAFAGQACFLDLSFYRFKVEDAEFLLYLDNAAEAFGAQAVHTLQLASEFGFRPEEWRTALARFMAVHTLALFEYPVDDGLWIALTHPAPDPHVDGQNPEHGAAPLLPALDTLAFRTADFISDYLYDHERAVSESLWNMAGPSESEAWRELVCGLVRRRERGGSVRRIEFEEWTTDCVDSSRRELDMLRKVVPEVEATPVVQRLRASGITPSSMSAFFTIGWP
jgi:hypothetical protein